MGLVLVVVPVDVRGRVVDVGVVTVVPLDNRTVEEGGAGLVVVAAVVVVALRWFL